MQCDPSVPRSLPEHGILGQPKENYRMASPARGIPSFINVLVTRRPISDVVRIQ
jgi:hypothetical protein